MYTQIRLAIQAGVALIILDRESKRNAQSRRMAAELLDALQRVEDSEARAQDLLAERGIIISHAAIRRS